LEQYFASFFLSNSPLHISYKFWICEHLAAGLYKDFAATTLETAAECNEGPGTLLGSAICCREPVNIELASTSGLFGVNGHNPDVIICGCISSAKLTK